MRLGSWDLWPTTPTRTSKRERAVDDLADLRKRIDDADSFHQQYYDDMDKWERYYTGEEQHDELYTLMCEAGQSRLTSDIVTVNYLYSTVEHYIAQIAQSMPVPYVAGNDASQDEASQAITDYLHAYGRATNIGGEQEMAYRSALVRGTGALKVYWCPRRQDVVVRNLPVNCIVPDPGAARIEDCSFIALRNEYSEDLAVALWPKLDLEHVEEVDPTRSVGVDTSSTTEVVKVLVWECYREFGKRLTIFTSDQVLYDGENPTPGGRYPLTCFRLADREDCFWGQGLVERLQVLQTDMNKLHTRMRIHHRFTTNPVVVTSSKKEINVTPGEVIRTETPDIRVDFLRPERIPPQVYDTLELDARAIDSISGVHDITRGIRPKGVTAGISLDILQQAAAVRLNGPARNWSFRMAGMWQAVLELSQKYAAGDLVAAGMMEGHAGMAVVPREMLSEATVKYDEDGMPVVDPETGQPELDFLPLPYHIVMQQQGELPLNAAAFAQTAIQLAQIRPEIDLQAILEAVKYPGRERLLQRLAANKQAELAGYMAAQGQMPGGATPPQAGMTPALQEA